MKEPFTFKELLKDSMNIHITAIQTGNVDENDSKNYKLLCSNATL
jgi:hypothetical protein